MYRMPLYHIICNFHLGNQVTYTGALRELNEVCFNAVLLLRYRKSIWNIRVLYLEYPALAFLYDLDGGCPSDFPSCKPGIS